MHMPARFPDDERATLLQVKGVGPTVVTRLEQLGYASLVQLASAEAGDIVATAAAHVGSSCWRNSPQARAAIDQIKGEKVIHFVKRRRKHSSQRTKGHRQHLTLVRVTDVLAAGADATGVAAATGTADARRAAHNTAPAAPVEAPAKPKRAAKAAAAQE